MLYTLIMIMGMLTSPGIKNAERPVAYNKSLLTDVIYQNGYSEKYEYDKLKRVKTMKTFGPDEKGKIKLISVKDYTYSPSGNLQSTSAYYDLQKKGAMSLNEYEYTDGLLLKVTNYTIDNTKASAPIKSFNNRFIFTYQNGRLIKDVYQDDAGNDAINSYKYTDAAGICKVVVEHNILKGESSKATIELYKGVIHPVKIYDPASGDYMEWMMKSTVHSQNKLLSSKQQYTKDTQGRVISITNSYPNQGGKPEIIRFKYAPVS